MLCGMKEPITLIHERVDDIPLLLGIMNRLGLAELVDQHLGNHGNQQGLSNGWVLTIWLAFILAVGDHRKSTVRAWVQQHQQTLERLTGQTLRPDGIDYTDDRLGIVLRRLSDTDGWNKLEAQLWACTMDVYAFTMDGVHVDSTTVSGYHTVTENGVMQYGHSKDHRPDLPQLKLMVAAAQPTGSMIATDVVPGNQADDPLYLPLIARVRTILNMTGVIYSGDSKMAAIGIRGTLVANQDYYVVPLPMTGTLPQNVATWIDAVVDGAQEVQAVCGANRVVGAGYEVTRTQTTEVEGTAVTWDERVIIFRSTDLARQQAHSLEQRLAKAEAKVQALTPPPGRGHRVFREEAALEAAVQRILETQGVTDLLTVTWEREETVQERYVGPGRGGPGRPTRQEVQVRYRITTVQRNASAIAAQQWRMGWRVYATNIAEAQMPLSRVVQQYRMNQCGERNFHLLKDRPLGFSPMFVHRDDQIVGLSRLLTLGTRLMSLIETQTRVGLAQDDTELAGLYPGQPNRCTSRPTATRLLEAIARTEITLTCVQSPHDQQWYLTPLPDWIVQVLGYLGLSVRAYTCLIENST
jgi:transposase